MPARSGGATVGRDAELAATSAFVEALAAGPVALLVEGEAGIGKTTIWRAAVEAAQQRGYRVVTATAVDDEIDLPFVVLRDLLAELPVEVGQALPPVQREALEIALLRSAHPAAAADHHAVSAAVLGVLQTLAAERPLVIAVDDVGWLDRSSERVLRYMIHRLTGESVGILTARRSAADHQLPLGLDRPPVGDRLCCLELGPLDPGALHLLLSGQAELALPRRITRHIHRLCGGNPFYAREIARAVHHHGPRALTDGRLPLPNGLLASTADRLAGMSPPALGALAVVAEAWAPTVALVTDAVGEQAADGLTEAVADGLLEIDGGSVRFTHPLLRSAVSAGLSGDRRRALHRQLAQLVSDPDQRAVHLAAGASTPDEAVACALEQAAHRAFLRGAPDTAADLARRAVALTPLGLVDVAAQRKIATAEYHYRVEELDVAHVQLQEVIAELPAGGIRAEALLWLGTIVYEQGSTAEACPHVQQAITEAADDHVRAAAERHVALYLGLSGDAVAGEPYAMAALRTAQASGDPASIAESRGMLAWTQFLSGRGLRTDLLEGAQNQRWTRYGLHAVRPSAIGLMLCWSGQLEAARAVLRVEARDAKDHGADRALAIVLCDLAELECWAGRWDRAWEHATEGHRAAALTESEYLRCVLLHARGLINAHVGRLDDARADAEAGLAICESIGFALARSLHLQLLGFIELSLGDYAAAHRLLAPLAATVPAGDFEPRLMRFLLDEAEALVALGELEQADELLARFEAQAVRLARPWGLLAGGRVRSLWAAAGGDLDAAVAAADAALAAGDGLEMPFERARALLVAGSVRRRARRRREAREMLSAALAEFDRLGAPLWADRARAELDRIGGRAPSAGGLTEAERRIVELVVAGRTNREVAAELFLTVSTVEAALWKTYRKLGVRSRTELAARLAGD